MKPVVRGKRVYFREVLTDDAVFILSLRTDPRKSRFLSPTVHDVSKQRAFIERYQQDLSEYYFIICDWESRPLGTVRIYDIRGDSFSWGSWILSRDAHATAAVESALLVYDFGFYALHYKTAHFEVRRDNSSVVDFHRRFGALVTGEDELNFYFSFDIPAFLRSREKYRRFLP
jgi:RimJ/RimL family protein N-acetyltransferase